jgi:hypothetical protein
MPIPRPTTTEVTDALIAHVISDLAAGDTGIIPPVLSPYGVSIPTDMATDAKDAGEYSHVRFGGREIIPDGLSVYFFPVSTSDAYFTAPSGVQGDFKVRVQGIWRDTNALSLTDSPGKLWRMLSDFTAALATTLSPASLGAVNGGWLDVDGSGYNVIQPFCHQTLPCAFTVVPKEDKMNELVYFCEVAWGGKRYYQDP